MLISPEDSTTSTADTASGDLSSTSGDIPGGIDTAGPVRRGEERKTRPPVPFPEIPDDLLNAMREGNASLVMGGGALAQSGYLVGAPFLNRLLLEFKDQLPPAMVQTLSEVGDHQASTSLPIDESGRIIDAIASVMARDSIAAGINSIQAGITPRRDFQEALAGLPWHSVISLSWIGFSEPIFMGSRRSTFPTPNAGASEQWQSFTPDQAAELPAAVRRGNRLFLRPLGDLDRPSTLSLSMKELRRTLQRWPEFGRQVALLMQTQIFLFVGVSVDTIEEFLHTVAPDLEFDTPRHFALVPNTQTNDLLEPTLRRLGVSLLPYEPRSEPPNEHKAVPDFVDQLIRKYDEKRRERPAGVSAVPLDLARIEAVKLMNIGLFDTLELKFSTEAKGDGAAVPWTVVFGPNGCGKSTILKAIAVALAGNEAPESAGRLLRNGETEGAIEVQFGAHMIRTRLLRDRSRVVLQPGATTPIQGGLALVLGFPALRGAPSPNPGGVAAWKSHIAEPADLIPIITGDVDKRLGDFKKWLVNVLDQAGKHNERAIAMKTLLDGIIRDVVPGEFKKFAPLDDSYVIKVKTDMTEVPSSGDVPFDNLSQGMISIFNWLGVMTQRLYDFYPEAVKPENQQAIVLIDEIDAHLHPDWQRRIVELTKKFFPKVQVLATSHSALLAGALHGQEVCVLRRDPQTLQISPLEFGAIDPYGWSTQDILTSDVFGLSSTRNLDIEKKINRHVEISEKMRPSEAEIRELEKLADEVKGVGYVGAMESAQILLPDQDVIEALQKRFAKSEAPNAPADVTPQKAP